MTISWEYQTIQRNSSKLHKLQEDLNELGDEGWEMVGFASADKTIGLNSIMAIMKRPVPMTEVAYDMSSWNDAMLLAIFQDLGGAGAKYRVVRRELVVEESLETLVDAIISRH